MSQKVTKNIEANCLVEDNKNNGSLFSSYTVSDMIYDKYIAEFKTDINNPIHKFSNISDDARKKISDEKPENSNKISNENLDKMESQLEMLINMLGSNPNLSQKYLICENFLKLHQN